MSEESSGEVLRKSLDAIDAIRRRIMFAGGIAVVGTLGAFYWLTHVARTRNDLESVLMAAVLAQTFLVAWSTFALAVFITRMTRRVLRAIDLASKR